MYMRWALKKWGKSSVCFFHPKNFPRSWPDSDLGRAATMQPQKQPQGSHKSSHKAASRRSQSTHKYQSFNFINDFNGALIFFLRTLSRRDYSPSSVPLSCFQFFDYYSFFLFFHICVFYFLVLVLVLIWNLFYKIKIKIGPLFIQAKSFLNQFFDVPLPKSFDSSYYFLPS